jgi:hypothetical protein
MATDTSPVYGPEHGVPEIANALLALKQVSEALSGIRFRDPSTDKLAEVEQMLLDAAWEARTEVNARIGSLREGLFQLLRLIAR